MRNAVDAVRTESRLPVAGELAAQINVALGKSHQLNSQFFVVLVQVAELETFRQRRGEAEANALLRELLSLVRKAVHHTQYVGIHGDGLGMVFETADSGQVDLISRRLVGLCQQTIRLGGYNNPAPGLGEMILHMLAPKRTPVLAARAGWAIYPRDGGAPADLIRRAFASVKERSR